jgi:DNA-binding response OmpR family regulator
MRRIRGKLGSIDAPVEIETVRGVGFRLLEQGGRDERQG